MTRRPTRRAPAPLRVNIAGQRVPLETIGAVVVLLVVISFGAVSAAGDALRPILEARAAGIEARNEAATIRAEQAAQAQAASMSQRVFFWRSFYTSAGVLIPLAVGVAIAAPSLAATAWAWRRWVNRQRLDPGAHPLGGFLVHTETGFSLELGVAHDADPEHAAALARLREIEAIERVGIAAGRSLAARDAMRFAFEAARYADLLPDPLRRSLPAQAREALTVDDV